MAQNVIINGVTYSNVPQVDIPKADSGTASFYDTSDATLDSGGKMLSGNTAYANGVKERWNGHNGEHRKQDIIRFERKW